MSMSLTRNQLGQLIQEYQTLLDWITIRDFAAQVYGPDRAATIEIETYGVYNDEGGTNYSVQSLHTYGKLGERLPFDTTLPFWAQDYFQDTFIGKTDEEEIQQAALDALKEYDPWRVEDTMLAEQHGWLRWEDLPVNEHTGEEITYDLTSEPSLTFPVFSLEEH